MKKVVICFLTLVVVGYFLISFFSKGTLSTESTGTDNLKLDLRYNSDKEILNSDIFNFIDLVDNSLFAMSSYNMSSKLKDNYDFLTVFAISFILNNEDYYKDNIVLGDEYVYEDVTSSEYRTNKYISVDILYDVTNNVFGKSNYMIMNDYLTISNGMVPLLLIKDNNNFMEIDEIMDIVKFSNRYNVYVKYKNLDFIYVYEFENLGNKLTIDNVYIGE